MKEKIKQNPRMMNEKHKIPKSNIYQANFLSRQILVMLANHID